MNEQEFTELAAGHALHALSAADEQRFVQAVTEHPQWQASVVDDEQTAAMLADALAPVQPPPALRRSLLTQISSMPQAVAYEAGADERIGEAVGITDDAAVAENTAVPADPAHPRRWSRTLFALAACLVLLVGGGIATTVVVSQLQRPASVVALDEIRSAPDAEQATVKLESGATATAHWSGELGEAVLVTSGLDRPETGKTFELWFVRGDQPVSAGIFDTVDGQATALLDGSMQAGDAIAVTVEQTGGSPSGAPTSDPIVVIPTA